MLETVVDTLNQFLWSPIIGPFPIIAYVLVCGGVYLTIRTRGLQFRLFRTMMTSLRDTLHHTADGVSGFQAFSTSLASRVGVGNIVGVATALAIGGPGAIFWMWVVALLGMATSMVESTLAQVYKVVDGNDFRGGPAYYVRHGLGRPLLGAAVAILTIAAYLFAFGPIQANAMATSLDSMLGLDVRVSGLLVAGLSALVVLGGIHRIGRVAELVVPFMAVAYVAVAALAVLMNIGRVPDVLSAIVSGAFGGTQLAGGLVGGGVVLALQMGVARGLFSNEAGLGTTPNAAGAASVPHPVTQGLAQGFGVFIDTVVICTATALTILLSGAYTPATTGDDAGGLTAAAMADHLGTAGGHFVSIALLFFAFTSIVAFGYFIETNVWFLGLHPHWLTGARLLFVALLYVGAVKPMVVVWASGDAFLGLLGLCNMVAIGLLSSVAARALRDYEEQRRSGIARPIFEPAHLGRGLPGQIDHAAWPTAGSDRRS